MKIQSLLLVILLCLASAASMAQARVHLVYFRDKANSPFSVNRPQEFLSQRAIDRRTRQNIRLSEQDLPVNPAYLDSVRRTGAAVLYPSRWFNGAIVRATDAQMQAIGRLSVVRTALNTRLNSAQEPPRPVEVIEAAPQPPPSPQRTEESYGASFTQSQMIGIDAMHRAGFRGENMAIAVFDKNFRGTQGGAFANMRLLGTFNFVNQNQPSVYNSAGDDHGCRVLSTLAAYRDGELIGAAHRAGYYLFQTEDFATESKAEEAWWLAAAERADSLGVDIISTSLGYFDFDDASLNYRPEDLNGRTAIISRAAAACARVGMIVVKSTGNEANRGTWRRLTFPADADSILAVGAVDAEGRYAAFSSRGPTADGRRKPDVAAQGQGAMTITAGGTLAPISGTSFATPLVAGLVAGFWQANPTLTNLQVMDFVRRSGSRFRTPNDSTGFGIPHFERMQFLVTGLNDDQLAAERVVLYPNPSQSDVFVAFAPSLQGQGAQMALYDAEGRLHHSLFLTVDERILQLPLAKYCPAPGVYLLKVSAGSFEKTFRLVRE